MQRSSIIIFLLTICATSIPRYARGETANIKSIAYENTDDAAFAEFTDASAEGDKIKASFTVKQEIQATNIAVTIDVKDSDGSTVFSKVFDFCEMAQNDMTEGVMKSISEEAFNGGECPIPSGDYHLEYVYTPPDGTAGNTYTAELVIKDNTVIKCEMDITE